MVFSLTGCQLFPNKADFSWLWPFAVNSKSAAQADKKEVTQKQPDKKNPAGKVFPSVSSPPDIPLAPVKVKQAFASPRARRYYQSQLSEVYQNLKQLGLKTSLIEDDLNILLLEAYEVGFIDDAVSVDQLTEEDVEHWKLNQPITRGELVHLLYKYLKPEKTYIEQQGDAFDLPTFDDVSDSHPYYQQIEWANRKRLMQGGMQLGNLRFYPNKPVPRQDLCALAQWASEQSSPKQQPLSWQASVEQALLSTPPFRSDIRFRFENIPATRHLSQKNQKSCAWFYQQGGFWQVFHLRPNRVIQYGFDASKPVTRWEALLTMMVFASKDKTETSSMEGK